MPDRTISNRDPIERIPPSSIELPRTVSSRSIAPREEGRGVTISRGLPFREQSGTELAEINRRILENLRIPFGSPSTNVQASDPTGNGLLPIYGTGSPADILADAFLRSFGGAVYNPPRQSERTVIESAGSGAGGSFTIIIILAAVGFGIYYFYLRK
jgi:hypothetical protein